MNTKSLYKANKIITKARLAVTIIVILLAISNITFSQGRRDFENTTYPPYNPFDTTTVYIYGDTSLTALDSTRLLPVDSTARVKYFTYVPEYSYGVKVREKTHPLLLDNSSLIQYNVQFDTANNVVIRKTFLGEDIQAPLVITVDEYIKNLSEFTEKKVFSELVAEKYQGKTQDELTELFQKFTDITIPLPIKTETIFGPPTINLRINGAIDITASYQNIKSDVTSATNVGTQNNINFKQEVLVTAKGTVGDKLTIDADWNTQRLFDFENQLKIKYEGYADEVIKKIEAGNVSLQTNSALIQSTQALFGIKGDFQLGPLSLSTVVSQKKSKQETKDYAGGVSEQTISISALEYSDNHYFLDTLYKTSFLDVFNSTAANTYLPTTVNNSIRDQETTFEVWVQTDPTQADKRFGIAITQLQEMPPTGYDPTDTSLTSFQTIRGIRTGGLFRKLSTSEYTIYPYAGFISLKINVPDNYAVGVTYRTQDGKLYGTPSTFTGVTPQDTLLLKMIKVPEPDPLLTPIGWELKLKNIYRLPVSKIIEEGFQLQVQYEQEGNLQPTIPINQTSLSTILKIDRFKGKTRIPEPDGLFDFLPGYTINTETGDIIFPNLRPFGDDIRDATSGDSNYVFSSLYTEKKANLQNQSLAKKYFITGRAKGEAGISNIINLGFNIVQGSVKLFLGAQELQNNVDYSVDYSTGVVVVKNAAALISKDLKVSYETNDLISLASKTLIGVRGDYKFSEKSAFGFTFVNLKQETLNDKVRIGEEPTNNTMFGVDFTTEFKPKLFTKLVNLLPGYNTKEESALTFRGEFAYILPDPNTKRSRIPQDNNESIAYVDDMEGSKKIVSLGTTYATWTLASLPLDPSLGSVDSLNLKQSKRGRFRWYNIPSDVDVKSVYPLRDVQPGQDKLTSFTLTYDPTSRGVYNYNNGFDTIQNKQETWNGIMKYLNTTSTDLIAENINFIEFNMRIVDSLGGGLNNGKIVIDIGKISEDAIPNRKLDTEDTLGNGTLDPNLDIGLDLLTDAQELDTFRVRNGLPPTFTITDPALDNNGTQAGVINFDVINGTQNNKDFEGGNKPDTEDLNRNGIADNENAYLQYEVPLDTTNNSRISGRGAPGSGWFQYRVPLSEFVNAFNGGTLTNVQYVRVWVTGVSEPVRLQLIDFNLVGNQWEKPNKSDTTYNISVVSIEENPQIYQSPVSGDILRQTVRNTSGNNTLSNEQSLALTVNNLLNGQRKVAVKNYNIQRLNLFSYKSMKLFVNGDPSFNYTDENIYDAMMVIRFGNDSNNYYEYKAPIRPDTRPSTPWDLNNEVTINFADLTAIKINQDTSLIQQETRYPVPNGPPGSFYSVRGNPALNNISQFVLGVEKNRNGYNSVITGSVWFNEIRVLNVEDDNGFAFNFNAGAKFADLLDISFNLSKSNPNFNTLDGRADTRSNRTGVNWDLGGTLNLHRFINNALASLINDNWKNFINLPLTFRHSEGLTKPRYYPGTDIELEQASEERFNKVINSGGTIEQALTESDKLKLEAQTLEVRNEFGISGMTFTFPGNNFLVTNILNKFVYNINAVFGSYRDVTFEKRNTFDVRGGVEFVTDFGLADNLHLNLGKIINFGDDYKEAKLYFALPFLPLAPLFSSNFNASADFNRNREEKKQRRFLGDDPTSRIFNANRGFGFDWKFIENWMVDLTGSYRFKIGSDLTGFETFDDSLRTQRPESEVLNSIFLNDALINFGRDLDYAQTTTFNPKFNIPFIKKFMDMNLAYNVTYGWNNPISAVNTGYQVQYVNNIVSSVNLRFNDLFGLIGGTTNGLNRSVQGRTADSSDNKSNQSIGDILKLFKTFFPTNVNVTFNQSNGVSNPGVVGRPGFGNFWMMPSAKEDFGPSRSYQLGFDMFPGNRVPNLNLTDQYNLSNDVSVNSTINPLLPDAIRMNLTFKKKWGFNNTNTYFSNDGVNMLQTNKSQNYRNTYTTFFTGNIENFRFEPSSTEDNKLAITNAFKEELSSFAFPNWQMTISGVEKFPFFAQFATQVTIDNAFTSEFTENFSVDGSSLTEIPTSQSITQGFNPLFGINITFKEAFGGNLTGTFKINNAKTYNLNPAGSNIQTTNTNDWSLNANFSKAGFNIPFFGLSLKNDIAFALTISKTYNEPVEYKFIPGQSSAQKIPGIGSTVMTINPTIQYSLSSRVQMQLFFKYIRTEPTQNTANTYPRTNNEGGLNIRISLQ